MGKQTKYIILAIILTLFLTPVFIFAQPDNDQKNIDIYTKKARVYFDKKEYTEAIKWFKEGLKINPRAAGLYSDLGRVYFNMRDNDEAIKWFKNGLAVDPGYPGPHEELGRIYLHMRNYTEAIKWFKDGIIVDPRNPGYYEGLGRVYLDMQNNTEAIKWFKKGIAAVSHNSRCYEGLGTVYMITKNYPEAIKWFKKGMKINSRAVELYVGLGKVYMFMNNYTEAIKWFKEGIKVDPYDPRCYEGLGRVYFNMQNNDEAIKLFKQSSQLSTLPFYACPYEGLGLVYLKQGKTKEAEASFKKAIAINPNIEYKEYNGLAKIYIKQGKIKEAKKLLEKSIKNYPYDDEASKIMADIILAEGLNNKKDINDNLINKFNEYVGLEQKVFKKLVFKPSSFQIKRGTSLKIILEDQLGRKWMFKPAFKLQAENLVLMYRVYSFFGLDTPEIHSVTLNFNGRNVSGTVQRFIDSFGTLLDRNNQPSDLTENALEYLLKTHVLTWICADYDANPANFIVVTLESDKVNSLMRIDHDAAFSISGQNKLNQNYKDIKFCVSYYDRLWKAYILREINLNLINNLEFVDFIYKIPNSNFREIFYPLDENNKKAFDSILLRKKDLFKDFTEFYDSLARQRKVGVRFAKSMDHTRIYERKEALREIFIQRMKKLEITNSLLPKLKGKQLIIRAGVYFGASEIMQEFRIYTFLKDKPNYISPYGKKTINEICDSEIFKLKNMFDASVNLNEKLALTYYIKEIEQFKLNKKPIDANMEVWHVYSAK